MPDKLVTIASHLTAQEAHLAVVGFVKGVKLLVADHQAERASEILATLAGSPADAPIDERMATTRTCPVCGEAFEPDCDYCPHCGPPADELVKPSESIQESKSARVEDEEDVHSAGDDMARRALWASIIGFFICPPLVTIYAMYLILRLFIGETEPRPESWRKVYVAFVFCALELGIAALFWRALLTW